MYIDVTGSGPDLVLIHGWAMHGGVFAPLLAELAPHFRVHVVDLPGHGHSRDDAAIAIGASAARIAATTPRALWVGWSLGGLVALRGALDIPSHVRGVCAIASSPRFVEADDWPHGVPTAVFSAFAADLDLHYRAAIERFLALETLGSRHAQAELRELRQQVFERGEPSLVALAAGLAALAEVDLRDDLARLTMPSLWIAGRRDRLVAAAAMQWAAAVAPGGRYLDFNSGHAPFIGHAAGVATALVTFAAGLAP